MNELTIENRVTNFLQSKRLKELNVSQELKAGDFFYYKDEFCFCPTDIDFMQFLSGEFVENETYFIQDIYIKYKAFDGTQIDEMLPPTMRIRGGRAYKIFAHTSFYASIEERFVERYENNGTVYILGVGRTRLEAKTNLLIELLEKGILKANEL